MRYKINIVHVLNINKFQRHLMKSQLKKRLDTLFPKRRGEVAKLFQYFETFRLSDPERQHFCDEVLFFQPPPERETFWTEFAYRARKNHHADLDHAGDYLEALIQEHHIRKDACEPSAQLTRSSRKIRLRFSEVLLGFLMILLYVVNICFVAMGKLLQNVKRKKVRP